MEMRKQGDGGGQGTARSASKSAAGRKQPGEQTSSSTNQEATGNQGATGGAAMNQGTTAHQGSSMNKGAAANQSTMSNQGGTGQRTGGEQDLLEHAKHATGQIMSKVQEQAGSQINRQKETAATELSQVANAVRRIRENLPEHEAGALGHYVAEYGDKAANGLERLSHYIREQDPKKLLDDVQNFGRRQPALLLGGAFLLGFAGARLIRSSMEAGSQHQSHRTNVQTRPYTATNVTTPRPSTTPSGL